MRRAALPEVRRAEEHRLAELEWTRTELQATHAQVRQQIKIRRTDYGRHGRRAKVAAACPEEIKLLRELDSDLRNISRQIDELRAWLNPTRFTPSPPS